MYFVVTPNNEPKQVDSEELATLCAMTAPGFIYFEADLCAPEDPMEMFILERTRLAQLVAAERSGFVNAEPMSDDFDTADKLLVVIEHETEAFINSH